jgi:hypothetical protein
MGENIPPWGRGHRRIEREAARVLAKSIMAESKNRDKSLSWREWVVSLGIPSLVIAVGWAVMVYSDFFWWGVIVVYGGLLFLVVDSLRLAGVGFTPKMSLVLVTLMFLSIFSWLVWRSSPLTVNARLVGSGYAGEMAGVNWQPEFGEVYISISNPTDRDYSDVNLSFSPGGGDFRVIEMVETSEAPKVELYAENGDRAPDMFIVGPDGRTPLIPSGSQPAPVYRIRADKLPRRSQVEIVAAIARLNPPKVPLPLREFAPFVAPRHMSIDGQFNDFFKPKKVTQQY